MLRQREIDLTVQDLDGNSVVFSGSVTFSGDISYIGKERSPDLLHTKILGPLVTRSTSACLFSPLSFFRPLVPGSGDRRSSGLGRLVTVINLPRVLDPTRLVLLRTPKPTAKPLLHPLTRRLTGDPRRRGRTVVLPLLPS